METHQEKELIIAAKGGAVEPDQAGVYDGKQVRDLAKTVNFKRTKGVVLAKVLESSLSDEIFDDLGEDKIWDCMRSKVCAWNIVSGLTKSNNGIRVLSELIKRDEREDKQNSIAYMKALRQSVLDNNTKVLDAIASNLGYSESTLLDILNSDRELHKRELSLPKAVDELPGTAYYNLLTYLSKANLERYIVDGNVSPSMLACAMILNGEVVLRLYDVEPYEEVIYNVLEYNAEETLIFNPNLVSSIYDTLYMTIGYVLNGKLYYYEPELRYMYSYIDRIIERHNKRKKNKERDEQTLRELTDNLNTFKPRSKQQVVDKYDEIVSKTPNTEHRYKLRKQLLNIVETKNRLMNRDDFFRLISGIDQNYDMY